MDSWGSLALIILGRVGVVPFESGVVFLELEVVPFESGVSSLGSERAFLRSVRRKS